MHLAQGNTGHRFQEEYVVARVPLEFVYHKRYLGLIMSKIAGACVIGDCLGEVKFFGIGVGDSSHLEKLDTDQNRGQKNRPRSLVLGRSPNSCI